MQFVFVTAISISTSETQYQNHRKKNNRKILLPVDQLLADLDLEKWHVKVIQRKVGAKNKLLEKRDENTIITCNQSTEKHRQLLLLQGNTQRRLSVKSLTTEIISSVPCTSQPRSLHLVHLHKPQSYFFCLLWATGWLVVFNWNLFHNLFHFDNGMQCIHVHFVLFAVYWNWFLVSKEVIKNGEISHGTHLTSICQGWIQKNQKRVAGTLVHLPAI